MSEHINSGEMIRPANSGDIEALVEIETRVSPAPWRSRQFRDSLDRQHVVIAEVRDVVAGFAIYSQVADEAELFNIAVSPGFQGKGIGGGLLDYCLEVNRGVVKQMFLEVRAGNVAAIHLYSSRAFVQTGIRKNYYPGPEGREDALLMRYQYNAPATADGPGEEMP